MITLGKRKFEIKTEDFSFLNTIKKPKQEFQIIKTSNASNGSTQMGKVIGMVADPLKSDRASKVICLKVSKAPMSLPSLSSITNTASLPTKNIIIPRLQNSNIVLKNAVTNNTINSNIVLKNPVTNNAINSNIVLKNPVTNNTINNNIVLKNVVSSNTLNSNIVLKNPISSNNINSNIVIKSAVLSNTINSNIVIKSPVLSNTINSNIVIKSAVTGNTINSVSNINPVPIKKTLVLPGLSSPKSPIAKPFTTLRIKTETSPLNSITNIVTPIKQDKPCSFDSSPKFPIKKECIIKPLNKNFFLQNGNNFTTQSISPPSNGSSTADKIKPAMRVISLHNGVIKQEKIDDHNFNSQATHVKEGTSQPRQMKTWTIPKVKPIVVVSPLNYRKPDEEEKSLEWENFELKSEVIQEVVEEPQTLFSTLEYDERVGFTVHNFPINSPLHLLKNMLINGSYLTEESRVTYLVSEQEVGESTTMEELCGTNNFRTVNIKFVFRELDCIFIDIYSVEISPDSMMQNGGDVKTEDQKSPVVIAESKKRKYMKKKDRLNPSAEKGNCGRVQLWQFLLMTLLERQQPDKIEWTSEEGEFRFIDPDQFAKVWGNFKNKRNMSYNNLSRAIRYYYEMGIMNKVKGHQFRYKFTLDIKATTGYTFREMRRLYEMPNFDLNSPEWEQFMVLRDLVNKPISAQTNPAKASEEDEEEMEEERDVFGNSPMDGAFEDDMSPDDRSLFNNFEEDRLACSNLSHLFPSSDDAFMDFSLDDAS